MVARSCSASRAGHENRKKEKKARVEKQKKNEERNMLRKAGKSLAGSSGVVRTKRGKKGGKSIPQGELVTQMHGEKLSTDQLRAAISVQAVSTASYGKFDNKVRNQRKSKLKSAKRRKLPVTGAEGVEKEKLAKVADRVVNKKVKVNDGIDMSRAVNMYQVAHDRERQRLNDHTFKMRDKQQKMSKRAKRK